MRRAVAILLLVGASGCTIGYHARLGSRDQSPHSVSAQLMYVSKYLVGATVASADVRDDVDSAGRSNVRYGIPLGIRVVDSHADEADADEREHDNDGRVELWPYAGWILDGGAHGVEAGLHLRYQRLAYLALGMQRTFGEHADTQGFVGIGADLVSACGCFF